MTSETALVREESSIAHDLFMATGEALLGVDEEMCVVCANPAAARLFARDELVGTSLLRLFPGLRSLDEGRIGVPSPIAVLERLEGRYTPLDAQRGERTLEAEVLAARHRGDDGPPLWALVVRDVTELNYSHQLLLEAHQELEEFNRLAVGRELRMIELKREVNGLLLETGRPPRYDIQG